MKEVTVSLHQRTVGPRVPKDFSDFINPDTWRPYAEHFRTAQSLLRSELQVNAAQEREIRAKLRVKLENELKSNVFALNAEQIKAAQQILQSNVCAIDGTLAKVDLLSGIRSQIGVVACTYANFQQTYVAYVTEATYANYNSADDVLDVLKDRKREKRAISDLVLRATMAYWERRRALEQSSAWKIVHGEFFPFELRSGLGELKALPITLGLFKEIAEAKNIGSVVSDSTGIERFLGYALKRNEYMIIGTLFRDYKIWLDSEAHFSASDAALFKEFNEEYCKDFLKCVYRVGPRPFLFYCHREKLHEFAAILIADSNLVPERGFPILIDYADSICASLFRAGDFERRVAHELALQGELLAEQSERANRAR